jgi:hypothetical protein
MAGQPHMPPLIFNTKKQEAESHITDSNHLVQNYSYKNPPQISDNKTVKKFHLM